MTEISQPKIILNGIVLLPSQAGAVLMAIELVRNLIVGDDSAEPQAVCRILNEVLDIAKVGQ